MCPQPSVTNIAVYTPKTLEIKLVAMNTKGFTIIELMITVVLLSALLVVGVPSFATSINNNRMTGSINGFVSAITIARAEAVTRRANITMCKSADEATCTTANDWSQGWIIFIDVNTNEVVDAGDTILHVHSELDDNLTLVGSAGAAGFEGVDDNFTIDSRGFARLNAGNFTLCDTRGANEARGLVFTITARISRTTDAAGDADEIENLPGGANLSC